MTITTDRPKTALLIVDVQYDFLPGGALGVNGGFGVIAPLIATGWGHTKHPVDIVVASRDAHPAEHCSFARVHPDGIWPDHCVDGTPGAQLHPSIAAMRPVVFDKATREHVDAYSAFDGTGLAEFLREQNVERVLVGGIATDYCVKATVMDALDAGFDTVLLTDAIAAVNVNDGDGDAAIAEMVEAGAHTDMSTDTVNPAAGELAAAGAQR